MKKVTLVADDGNVAIEILTALTRSEELPNLLKGRRN
jgi:hypothetical protein